MKKIVIIQARTGSSRLPNKVLKDMNGRLVIERVVTAAKTIPFIDKVVVATTDQDNDKAIEQWCNENSVECFKGSENNVLERYYKAAQYAGCKEGDLVIRLTADCPLLDPQICGQVIELLQRTNKDYANNIGAAERLWPDGTDCEAFTFQALETSYNAAQTDRHKEHVTLYMRENPDVFDVIYLPCPIGGIGQRRWTLDTPNDFDHIKNLLDSLSAKYGEKPVYSYLDILSIEADEGHKELGNKNGFQKSLDHLNTALNLIPDASQTFSKSHRMLIKGGSPLFLDRGHNSYVWDIDGNCYIDYMSALLPMLLGYNDPDVDEAIKIQLAKGVSFSMPTILEEQLAERLIRLIPSAEMVKFGKNGSDVTSAAIRLARAKTGRTQIAICGYHGWHDWYIGSTNKKLGVPEETIKQANTFTFNDIDSLKTLLETQKYAAIIMEAEGFIKSENGFLEDVRKLATEHGAILVFDEIVSGFRSAMGGIQELRGVVPDLSCFGKAMGNGMPISALVGKKDIMAQMEDVFFSGTFGGEALSIAACIATLDKYERENGAQIINQTGATLKKQINDIFIEKGIHNSIHIGGEDWWPGIMVNQNDVPLWKKLIKQELFNNGIIQGSGFNLALSHDDPLIFEQTLEAWSHVAESMKHFLESKTPEEFLHEGHYKETFQVRS